MTDARMLNIVDENGNVIGEETRESIHRQGLLHKEIHVWFYTPRGGIIFQHRAKDKDTYPDLLDATVGGHVEIGEDYEKTAVKEIEEETGLKVERTQLAFMGMVKSRTHDKATGTTNHALRAVYAYCHRGKLEDLKLEKGKGIGFKIVLIDEVFAMPESKRKHFTPGVFKLETIETFRKIKELVK